MACSSFFKDTPKFPFPATAGAESGLDSPLPDVAELRFRVRIRPGTKLTVDVVKDGKLVGPRFLNYYPGTGEWEDISIPIGGRLNWVAISISEMREEDDTPAYGVEIDWIKAVTMP